MSVLPPRRRLQFGIRTLLFLMFFAALGAAWYGSRLRAARAQEQAFRTIAEKGGTILHYQDGAYIQFQPIRGGLCGTGLIQIYGGGTSTPTFGDSDLALLESIAQLRSIDFASTPVSPAAIQQFRLTHPHCGVTQ